MAGAADIGSRAYEVRIGQRLGGPAQAILGYQQLLVEEVRETGPADALPDLERALGAAVDLNAIIERLLAGGLGDAHGPEQAAGEDAEARLRHDLRTPMNAILGYAELVLEEFGSDLPGRLRSDIETVLGEGRALLARIDAIVGHARSDPGGDGPADEADAAMAREIARSLAAPAGDPAAETGRILVIDDVPSNRDLLARRLVRDGHTVCTAASGREALALLRSETFDLALVDILMPDMNGIELLARLKAEDRLRDLSVVMVSGLRESEAVVRCIEAGAVDYLPKPVDPVLLRARIAACLERSRWREKERRYLAIIEAEKERADALLHAMLPGPIVRRLAAGEELIADRFESVTILFADIVGFTPIAAVTEPVDLLRRLGALFSRFDELADLHGVEKIKTIGDAYMAAAGLPEPRPDHARRVIALARAMIKEAAAPPDGGPPLLLRIGVHTGPVVAGLIGRRRSIYDIWGHTVNVASRLESHGTPGRIQLSRTTLDALGSDEIAARRTDVELKGLGPTAIFQL
ncbi:adenylate/guanylate cyclase domain-containing protein [Marinimicrococcus flavescens]|uniref:histidine kinase n=1 Tax=Marinimicrococcus flavescens TaxID=3031815 RepID=A0AAP4D567_9PROT|nr:adenylate/guanylate cyclase domain-containing protein [Marinimicrococcus flavescens]